MDIMMRAAEENNLLLLKNILSTSQDATATDLNRLLAIACERGYFLMTKCLIKMGADINAKNAESSDITNFLVAVFRGEPKIIKFLLSSDPEITINVCNDKIKALACYNNGGQLELINYLMDTITKSNRILNKKVVDIVIKSHSLELYKYIQNKKTKIIDYHKNLEQAALYGSLDIIKYIIEQDLQDADLYKAFNFAILAGQTKIVDYFIKTLKLEVELTFNDNSAQLLYEGGFLFYLANQQYFLPAYTYLVPYLLSNCKTGERQFFDKNNNDVRDLGNQNLNYFINLYLGGANFVQHSTETIKNIMQQVEFVNQVCIDILNHYQPKYYQPNKLLEIFQPNFPFLEEIRTYLGHLPIELYLNADIATLSTTIGGELHYFISNYMPSAEIVNIPKDENCFFNIMSLYLNLQSEEIRNRAVNETQANQNFDQESLAQNASNYLIPTNWENNPIIRATVNIYNIPIVIFNISEINSYVPIIITISPLEINTVRPEALILHTGDHYEAIIRREEIIEESRELNRLGTNLTNIAINDTQENSYHIGELVPYKSEEEFYSI